MTLSFLAYAISKNPEIQEKLQEEVDQAFEANDDKLPDYNTIQNLPYLVMVILETLRKFSPIGLNTRSYTEDYSLPGTDITIKKDDLITFFVAGMHHDPEFWSHPDEFYPDHFSKEEKATRSP
jgi:cytochrome P450